MPKIYLLRHCDYANPRGILPGRLPVELSEAGKQRAAELQQIFAPKKISTIYSSAVKRCKQTAEIISGGQIPIVYDQRLLETFSPYQGYWVEDEWKHFFGHLEDLGGESIADIKKRVLHFYEELLSKLQPEEHVIICSHGDPLQALYAQIKGLPLSDEQHLPEELKYGWLEKGEFLELQV